jgi:hypothetical protein
LTTLADHLLSRGVTTAPPFNSMPEHQAELQTASAALRLLASHKAGFARIRHGDDTVRMQVEQLDTLRNRLDDHALTIANFPRREIAQDLALASRAADDLRSLRQDIAAATDWIGG